MKSFCLGNDIEELVTLLSFFLEMYSWFLDRIISSPKLPPVRIKLNMVSEDKMVHVVSWVRYCSFFHGAEDFFSLNACRMEDNVLIHFLLVGSKM